MRGDGVDLDWRKQQGGRDGAMHGEQWYRGSRSTTTAARFDLGKQVNLLMWRFGLGGITGINFGMSDIRDFGRESCVLNGEKKQGAEDTVRWRQDVRRWRGPMKPLSSDSVV
jgi:hypothetical protein